MDHHVPKLFKFVPSMQAPESQWKSALASELPRICGKKRVLHNNASLLNDLCYVKVTSPKAEAKSTTALYSEGGAMDVCRC